MILFKYINEPIPFNRDMANEIGIDYANDGKSIRYDPVRVEVDSWTESHQVVCNNRAKFGECLGNNDCTRCSECNDYESEIIEIRTPKQTYVFARYLYRQLGSVWTDWLDESYAITPAE